MLMEVNEKQFTIKMEGANWFLNYRQVMRQSAFY